MNGKIFFDITNGNIIEHIQAQLDMPNMRETTIEQDVATWKSISERNRETFDVLELPFGAYEQDFAECTGYRVNVETKTLEFSYPDPNAPQEPPVFQKPLTEQILQLKENQVATNRIVEGQGASQQDLLELLIDMGVI